jgi:hypothetical protein
MTAPLAAKESAPILRARSVFHSQPREPAWPRPLAHFAAQADQDVGEVHKPAYLHVHLDTD